MWGFKKNIYMHARVGTCLACVNHDVVIDTQTWMGCNLNVSTYRDGTPIPQISDSTAWTNLTTGAWCHYNNDPANDAIYGKLYNWHAVNDPRGLAPSGYHIPSDTEWTTLTDFLGGLLVAGGKMKEEGTCHWLLPNSEATNSSLFTGLPGGGRNASGNYFSINSYGNWWSSTENDTDNAWSRILNNNLNGTAFRGIYNKNSGWSVRLIKDPGHIE